MHYSTYLNSPLGHWQLSGSELGLSSVKWVEKVPAVAEEADLPVAVLDASRQLREYFEGDRTTFDIKLDFSGAPDFHRRVWEELLQVPYGHTTTYLSLALKLGDRKAVRAVGQANGANPIAIIVPCHRCIASDGDLQGYFYGLDFKRKLLALENPVSFAEQGELF